MRNGDCVVLVGQCRADTHASHKQEFVEHSTSSHIPLIQVCIQPWAGATRPAALAATQAQLPRLRPWRLRHAMATTRTPAGPACCCASGTATLLTIFSIELAPCTAAVLGGSQIQKHSVPQQAARVLSPYYSVLHVPCGYCCVALDPCGYNFVEHNFCRTSAEIRKIERVSTQPHTRTHNHRHWCLGHCHVSHTVSLARLRSAPPNVRCMIHTNTRQQTCSIVARACCVIEASASALAVGSLNPEDFSFLPLRARTHIPT
jgi:hypothetical protein